MKSTLSRFTSVLLFCLLFLSGQVFAVAYYSVPGTGLLWSAPSTWSGSGCGLSVTTGPVAAPLPGDTLTICNLSAVRVNEVSVGTSATVNLGGTLDLSTNVLDLGAAGVLTNDGGTILSDVQALVAQSIIHNSGTTNLNGVTTTATNSITVNGPGLELSPLLTDIDNLFTSNVDFLMPSTVLSLVNINVTGGILTLDSTKNIITGTVTINTGASVTGQNGGSTVYNASLPTPPPCDSTTHHLTGSAGAYLCVANPISAPIFSVKEKARVFTEEVID